jgi:hypothetical protein
MNKRGTGSILWPLVTGNNNDPTLTQGKKTSFFCNTVPDRCPTGPLAYYLPVFLMTIVATLNQPASGGQQIFWDELQQALVSSVNMLNCWYGSPISQNYVTGPLMPVVEFVQNGFVRPVRERPPYPSGLRVGGYPVEYTFALRPATNAIGDLETETAQLALLYQTGEIAINVADASVIQSLSPGATLTNISAQISAVLVPRNELVLGTPIEAVVSEAVAGSNASFIQIKGFGTDTALTGIESKGGVLGLLEMTNVNGQGGCFALENVQQYNFPWRGQDPTTHIIGFQAMNGIGQLPASRSQALPIILEGGGDSSMNNPPYAMSKLDELDSGGVTNLDLSSGLYLPMVFPGEDVALSDVQTADSDKQYYLQVNGGFGNGTHVVLGFYARRFNDAMRAAWVKKITGGNDPLANYVLGADNVAKAVLGQRVPNGKHLLTTDNYTYLPWQLSAPT